MSTNTEYGPRCRLCGYSLKSTDGCITCSAVKPHLVWPVYEDTDSVHTAKELTQYTAQLLKRQARKLEKVLKSSDEYDPRITGDLTKLGRTIKELAGEVRKLEDRDEEEYGKLGFEGRMNLFVDQFFARLPQEHQLRLLSQMKTVLEKQSTSLLTDE